MQGANTEERRLAAIMFTDMVGYSALAQSDEAVALELLEEHWGVLRGLFPKHRGKEIKTTGDGFLVEFVSALAAVECAVEIQKSLAERNLTQPGARRLAIRIGIHLGDVVQRGDDILGDGVNIAKRIEQRAEAGGVCVSSAVYDQVSNKIDSAFVLLSSRKLKNIEAGVQVYKLLMDGKIEAPKSKSLIWLWSLVFCIGGALGLMTVLVAKHLFSPNPSVRGNLAAKPLPTKTIPRPEPTPEPSTNQNVRTQEVAATETNKAFEHFTPDESDTNSFELLMKQFEERKAQKAREEAKAAAAAAAAVEVDRKKWWHTYLPHYRYALISLRDALFQRAAKERDGISQSEGYLQALPDSLDSNVGEFKAAEIRLQKLTNVDFIVSVTQLNGGNHRQLIISCKAGQLEMEGEWGESWHCSLHVDPDFDERVVTNYDNANEIISASIKELIAAQYYSLSKTRKQ